jgi:hypothetical protein
VSTLSPAHRTRGKFVRFGLWTSVLAFVIIEGDALLDQSQIGHASLLFMFGTACLALAACIALFAIIAAIGLAASSGFNEAPRQHQPARSQDAPVVTAHESLQLGQPPTSLAPGRSRSRRNQQSRPVHRMARETNKAPPQNVTPKQT